MPLYSCYRQTPHAQFFHYSFFLLIVFSLLFLLYYSPILLSFTWSPDMRVSLLLSTLSFLVFFFASTLLYSALLGASICFSSPFACAWPLGASPTVRLCAFDGITTSMPLRCPSLTLTHPISVCQTEIPLQCCQPTAWACAHPPQQHHGNHLFSQTKQAVVPLKCTVAQCVRPSPCGIKIAALCCPTCLLTYSRQLPMSTAVWLFDCSLVVVDFSSLNVCHYEYIALWVAC